MRHYNLGIAVILSIGFGSTMGCTQGGVLREKTDLSVTDKIEPMAPKPTKKKTAEEAGTYMQQLAKGRSLEASGKPDEARTVYGKMIAELPNRFEAHHRLAVVADQRRRHKEAQEHYTHALQANPENPEIHNDLAFSLFLSGKLNEAERSARKAIALAPKNVRYLNNLGLIHGHQGKIEQALADFRQGGSEADAQYNLAFILAAKNDIEGAKQCFRKALAANPRFELASRALRNFEKVDNDPAILAEADDFGTRGVRLVPYVEGAENSDGSNKAQLASATSGGGRNNTRNLQSQARSMMQDRIAGDR